MQNSQHLTYWKWKWQRIDNFIIHTDITQTHTDMHTRDVDDDFMRHLQHREPHGRQQQNIEWKKREERCDRTRERTNDASRYTIQHTVARRAQWIIIVTIIIENVHKMHYKTIVTNYTIHDVYLVIAIERRRYTCVCRNMCMVMILLLCKCIPHIWVLLHSGGGGGGDDGARFPALGPTFTFTLVLAPRIFAPSSQPSNISFAWFWKLWAYASTLFV